MRNTTIYLLNCYMLDNTYNHTVNFNTRENQFNWFFKNKIYTISDSRYSPRENNFIIDYPIHQLDNVNYLMAKNENEQWLYYFIIDKIYVNDNATRLVIQLDVFQSYYFDINFTKVQSLVDRQHVREFYDSTPHRQYLLTPEDLEIGEYVETARHSIYDYSNKGGYIVTSSDKLSAKNGGSTSGGGSDGNWQNGILSAKGFRFIKGYEAYAPYKYQDSSGYWTIAYGVTLHGEPDIYNELLTLQPVSEEKASTVSYELKNSRYGSKIINACKDLGVTKQNQFDALLSLAYNCGYGVVTGDNSLTRAIKSGSAENIRSTWHKFYITSDGEELEGLKLRRIAEANIFLDGNYEMRQIPKLNSSGTIIGYVTENNGDGWLPTDTTTETSAVVESARKLIGKPYVWGGNYSPLGNDNGTDCSGLMQWAYNDNGIKITRTTYTQIKEGTEISHSDIQLGDLVFTNFSAPNTPEHVFMFSGYDDNNNMLCVEAPRTGLNIRERIFTFTSDTRIRRVL